MTTPVNQIPIGALYGLPGYTEAVEQYDNMNNVQTAFQASAQTPFNAPGPLQKTDVVFWWEAEFLLSWALTFSAGVPALSPEAPYNWVQSPKLQLQGQYSPLECESGFDVSLFQLIRPMRGKGQRNIQDALQTNVVPAGGFANQQIPSANQAASILTSAQGNNSTGVITSASPVTSYPMIMEIPAGYFFDEYWDLAPDGSILPNAQGVVAPMQAFVSPQYMGGGERNIVPNFKYASIVSGNYDEGPIALSTATALTASVETGSAILNMRRVGVFASENPAEMPPVFNWQYRRASRRQTFGNVTKVDIPIQEYGQVLMIFVRIFDPTLNGGNGGGYMNVTNITVCRLVYGSNLPRFDDDMAAMQKRFIEQHGFTPPQGTVIWDLAATKLNAKVGNSGALNTLTNANCHVHLEFTSAPGAGTYAVVGTELLVPVAVQ
ncbi:MAG: hypothetical protein ACRD19_05000 [Terriglobia bacterium]